MCCGNFSHLITPLAALAEKQDQPAQIAHGPQASRTCPDCGTVVTPEFTWCPRCGRALKDRRCNYCRQIVRRGEKICEFCGAPAIL